MTALEILLEAKQIQKGDWGSWYSLGEVVKKRFPELEKAELLLVKGRHDLEKAIDLAMRGVEP